MAQAGPEFVNNLLRGLKGEKGVVACTMVESHTAGCKYFALPVELGPNGVSRILGLGNLSAYEKSKLEKEVAPELQGSITKGEKF